MAMVYSVEDLKTIGHVNVDYPTDLRALVKTAVQSWIDFCQLPKEEKAAFAFLEDTHGDGAGYELKEERRSKRDLKENFHVTLFQYPRLSKIANRQTFPFLIGAKALLDQIEPLIVEFATSVEEQYGIAGVVDEVLLSKPYWILRYLHYFGDREEGDEIASPHIDKGGLTLHLYESDDGLQAYSFVQRRWKGIPIEEKQTVIISAAQLQLQSKGLLKALTHRVIATEKTARTGRFSMVCFVPFQNLPMYNKEVYGSMQIHDTGFNYDLSHSDFKRFFCQN